VSSTEETDGRFSLLEHPLEPNALASPLHRHANEDEYSFVLAGRMGAQLGDEVVYGEPGDLIFKPRGQWHAFWNAGDEPDPEKIAAVAARYQLDLDPESIPRLAEEHDLQVPGAPEAD
jgi:uncharacterized cupin superfamily protein